MNKVKTIKKLAITFVGITLLLLLGKVLFRQQKEKALLLAPETAGKAAKIEFQIENSSFTLARKDAKWHLVYPFKYPTNSHKVDDILSKVQRASVNRKLTRRKGKYNLFGLLEPTILKIWAKNGKVLSTLKFGDEGPFEKTIFVLKSGDEWVRQAEGISKYELPENLQDIIYKRVFPPLNDIFEIKIKHGKKSLKLFRKEKTWLVQNVKIPEPNVKKLVEPLINSLLSLEADEVMMAKPQIKKVKETFNITVGYAKDQQITLRAKKGKDGPFEAMVSNRPQTLLKISSWKFNPFKKTKNNFLSR